MKRIKQVFSNKELAHIWASQSQDTGRNTGNTMFFSGTKIYSYGSHYTTAKIYPEFGNVVLVNNHGYSMSTSQQRSLVCSAVSHRKVFYVSKPDDIEQSLKEMGDSLIVELMSVFSQTRLYLNIDSHFKLHNELCDIFKLKSLKIKPPKILVDMIKEYVEYRSIRNKELTILNAKKQLVTRNEYMSLLVMKLKI